MKKEIQRFYCAFRSDGAFMYFRNDNLEMARDHADHCVTEPSPKGLKIVHVGFVGTSEPRGMGIWQMGAGR